MSESEAIKAIKAALRIRDIWLINNPGEEHIGEAQALRSMEKMFIKAVESYELESTVKHDSELPIGVIRKGIIRTFLAENWEKVDEKLVNWLCDCVINFDSEETRNYLIKIREDNNGSLELLKKSVCDMSMRGVIKKENAKYWKKEEAEEDDEWDF